MGVNVILLMDKLKEGVTDLSLLEANKIQPLTEPPQALAALAKDAGKSLAKAEEYYEEAKVQVQKEKDGKALTDADYQKIMGIVKKRLGLKTKPVKDSKAEEGKVPNSKDTTTNKIKDLIEQDELPPESNKSIDQPIPELPVEVDKPLPPEGGAVASQVTTSTEAQDLVDNMAAAKEHFDKGNFKVAKELLKLVKDNIKDFDEQIKVKEEEAKLSEMTPEEKKDAEAAAAARDKAKEKEAKESKIEEQNYTVVARGFSDKNAAQELATQKKGTVVQDDTDKEKFMVIVKEDKEDVPINTLKDFKALAEQALLVKYLKSKPNLTDEQKHFIATIEAIELTDKEREQVTNEISHLALEKRGEMTKVEAEKLFGDLEDILVRAKDFVEYKLQTLLVLEREQLKTNLILFDKAIALFQEYLGDIIDPDRYKTTI